MSTFGLTGLRKIQLAKENPSGTLNTTATAMLLGKLDMEEDAKWHMPDDFEMGNLSSYEGGRAVMVGEQAKLSLNMDATYQQIGYILNSGIVGVAATGPTDSLYTYTHSHNPAALNALYTYSIQYGDNIQAFLAPYCFCTDFEISGKLDEPVTVKANMIGARVRTGSFTSLTLPTGVHPIVTGTGKLYIDTSWAGLGGSNIAATLVDFSYKRVGKTGGGLVPVKYIDGNLYHSDISEEKSHIELALTLAFNSTVAGYFANFITSPAPSAFYRIKFTGSLVGVTAAEELDLDGCFMIKNYKPFQTRNGQNIVTLNLVSQRDTVSGKDFQVIVKNGLSALP